MAKKDLANRLSINIEAIKVNDIKSFSWPNTALGCPKPGMMYAHVITPGYRLTLEYGGKLYDYHTDRRKLVILCGPQDDLKNNPF